MPVSQAPGDSDESKHAWVPVNYPNFNTESIQKECAEEIGMNNVADKESPYYFVRNIHFKCKSKRKDDLVVFQRSLNIHYSLVILLENPNNRCLSSEELYENQICITYDISEEF